MDNTKNGYAVLYRWRLHPGHEADFVAAWERVTRAMHDACGSYGSRLHRTEDGLWTAYARWPDKATRDGCRHGDSEAEAAMAAAVAEGLPAIHMSVVSDLLTEPEEDQ